jgi:glycosyltransferase involved in cell wall biosynthesis
VSAYPKISIVTPCFNDASFLEATILSVIDQNYPNLEYIIIDGGSTDGCIEIIKKYAHRLAYWESIKDNGMYHAIQKGFDKSTGEVMGWINSDDIHQPGSLFTIAQVFTDFNHVHWLTGMPNAIDEKGRIVYVHEPLELNRFFFYNHKHIKSHQYLQQESTFWRRTLWNIAGGNISQQYKYAGDFDLWIRFFKHQTLFRIPALLASFRFSKSGQASIDHYPEYVSETLRILERNPLTDQERRVLKKFNRSERIENVINRLVKRVKRNFADGSVNTKAIRFDPTLQKFEIR